LDTPTDHTIARRRLIVAAVLALIVGFVAGSIEDLDAGFTLKKVVTVFAFACALVFIALAGLAYVLHQHEQWREGLRRQVDQ
jgi:uncharacterized membrane protein